MSGCRSTSGGQCFSVHMEQAELGQLKGMIFTSLRCMASLWKLPFAGFCGGSSGKRLFGQDLQTVWLPAQGRAPKKETGTMRLMDYEWSKPESNKLLSNPTSHVSTGIKGIQGHMVTSSRAGKNRGWSVPVLLRMPRLLRALACLLRLRVKEFTPQGILVILMWGRLKTSCPFSLALCGIKSMKVYI